MGIAKAIRRRALLIGAIAFSGPGFLDESICAGAAIDADADYAVVKAILETPEKDLDLAVAEGDHR